ncbi:unnamed protein product [Caenorhabditis auriculariae]|uniref:Uncharacterized protein n=1 Tax=Caenorhabditis auriculariae TaxID=2777116 RepID=A0A8S1H2Q6_9PELO|nr:unnamed protein product [Caenorhabditis auriculariae]
MDVSPKTFQFLIYHATVKRNLKKIEGLTKNKSREYLQRALNLPTKINPLIEACRSGYIEIVRLLIRLGSDPLVGLKKKAFIAKHGIFQTALFFAVDRVGPKKVEGIVEYKTRQDFKIVRLLVETSNIDLKDSLHESLFVTLHYSNLGMVKYLCKHGANVQKKIFDYFIEHGLSVDATTPFGKTALHFAAEDGNLFLAKLLTAAGAQLIADKNGDTPLISAALMAYPRGPVNDTFEHFLDHYKDKQAKNDAILINAAIYLVNYCEENRVEALRKPWDEAHSMQEGDAMGELHPAYDYLREAKSFREFEAAEDLHRFSIMQCFIFLERVLGPGHPEVRGNLYDYVKYDISENFDPRDNQLRFHMLDIHYKYTELASRASISAIKTVLKSIFRFEEITQWKENQEERLALLELSAYLFDHIHDNLYMLERSGYRNADNRILQLLQRPSGLLRFLNSSLLRFVSLAHRLDLQMFHVTAWDREPSLIRLFVEAGADINELDGMGRTPLLSCVSKTNFGWWNAVTEFVANGARIFLRMGRSNLFTRLQTEQEFNYVVKPIVFGRYINLKDMAAEVVENTYSKKYLSIILPDEVMKYLIFKN